MEMAYYITDDCVGCGNCESECPLSCITPDDSVYVIDESVCTGCGACADICAVSAIIER